MSSLRRKCVRGFKSLALAPGAVIVTRFRVAVSQAAVRTAVKPAQGEGAPAP